MPWTESQESPVPTVVLGRATILSRFSFLICKMGLLGLAVSGGSGEGSGSFGMTGAEGQRSHGQNPGMARGRGKGTRDKVSRPVSLSEAQSVPQC